MPKCDWKSCEVCGTLFNGAEYLQLEIESSRCVPGPTPRKVQVVVHSEEDLAQLYISRCWYVGGWMTTRAVCISCVEALPPEWRKIFRKADLSDWVPVRRLDKGDGDTETWLVQRDTSDDSQNP